MSWQRPDDVPFSVIHELSLENHIILKLNYKIKY